MREAGRYRPPPITAAILFAALLVLFAAPSESQAGPAATGGNQVLLNGKFMAGSGDQPDNWRTEAWIGGPDAFAHHWIRPSRGVPGELEVRNLKPNDARWMQTLTLGPGWYYFSAEARTENVPRDRMGATISVMEDDVMSRDVRGTADWTPLGFYLRVGPHGADIDVALRLGGYGSLNTGRAFFRNASVVKIPKLPPGAYPAFDLEQIRKAMAPTPTGSPISLAATLLALLAIAAGAWHAFGKEPQGTPRAEARRSRTKGPRKR